MANLNNGTLSNFIGGELSPRMAARFELEVFKKSLSWCQNFMPLPQGPVGYRFGSSFTGLTSQNKKAVGIPFQFSADDAIMIVATEKLFRFYRNDAVILNASTAISAVTKAAAAQVTANAHGLANGDEVFITGIEGMLQLNGNFYIVSNSTANTFELKDQFGNSINSTAFDAYTGSGTVASIFTLVTPYYEADLPFIRFSQVGDVMYLVCKNIARGVAYEPRKLIRSGFTNWSLATYTRTNEPFVALGGAPSAITQANPAKVTVTSTTDMVAGQVVYAEGIGGMTQLNGNFYTVLAVVDANNFTLADMNGVAINSTTYGAFTAGGKVQSVNVWPGCVAFTGDGRLALASSIKLPQGWWASRLPDKSTTRYDDYTTGTDDTFAAVFAFSPVNGQIDTIQEMIQFSGNFALMGASSILQVYGAATGQPATPTKINTTATIQGAAHVRPIVVNWALVFVDINGRSLKGLQYNLAFSDYATKDYNLGADHFGSEAAFTKLAYVKIPQGEFIWVLRDDGSLLCNTFNNIENLSAWSRHYVGGNGKVIDISVIRKSGGYDELWMIVERTMNNQIYRSVEVMSKWPAIPLFLNFYTNNETADKARWASAAWESIKRSTFLDMALVFDGTVRGVNANASITLSGTTGTVTATASAPVFQSSDEGQQLWKNYDIKGAGGGQATIVTYTSPTQVQLKVEADFDSAAVIPPGSWTFAVNRLKNLGIFEGQTVGVQTDGGGHPIAPVVAGAISLQWFASVIQVGYKYLGIVQTPNIDMGSKTGPANSKSRSIPKVRVRLDNSLGGKIGTSPYRTSELVFRRDTQIPNRVPPPFTGVIEMLITDQWAVDSKNIVLIQDDPSNFTLVALDAVMDTVEAS